MKGPLRGVRQKGKDNLPTVVVPPDPSVDNSYRFNGNRSTGHTHRPLLCSGEGLTVNMNCTRSLFEVTRIR